MVGKINRAELIKMAVSYGYAEAQIKTMSDSQLFALISGIEQKTTGNTFGFNSLLPAQTQQTTNQTPIFMLNQKPVTTNQPQKNVAVYNEQVKGLAKHLKELSAWNKDWGGSELLATCKKINKTNVIDVLLAYNKISPNESLIDMIVGNTTMDTNRQIEAIKIIFNSINQKLKEAQIDTSHFEKEFTAAIDSVVVVTSPTTGTTSVIPDKAVKRVNDIISALISLYQAKSNVAPEVKAEVKSTPAAQLEKNCLDILNKRKNSAQTSFNNQMLYDGWAGDVADGVSAIWGSKNRAKFIRQDLVQFDSQLKQLEEARKKGDKAFNDKFYEIFGIKYDAEMVISHKNVESRYQAASASYGIEQYFNGNFKHLLTNPALQEEYEHRTIDPMTGYSQIETTATKQQVFDREFENFAKFIGQGNVQKGKADIAKVFASRGITAKSSVEDKYRVLSSLAKEYSKMLHANTMKITDNKGFQAVEKEYEASYKAAFGVKNDIARRVTEYNNSQMAGAAVIKGGAILGGTLIIGTLTGGAGLSFLPAIAVTAGGTAGLTLTTEFSDRATSGYVVQGFKQNGIKGGIDGLKQALPKEEIERILKSAGIGAATVIAGGFVGAGIEVVGQTLKIGPALKGVAHIVSGTAVGAGAEYVQSGTVTIEGVAFAFVLSAAGQIVSLRKVGRVSSDGKSVTFDKQAVETARKNLGIADDVVLTEDVLKNAYRKMAKEYHPDKYANAKPEVQSQMQVKMQEINLANEVLRNYVKPATVAKPAAQPENNAPKTKPNNATPENQNAVVKPAETPVVKPVVPQEVPIFVRKEPQIGDAPVAPVRTPFLEDNGLVYQRSNIPFVKDKVSFEGKPIATTKNELIKQFSQIKDENGNLIMDKYSQKRLENLLKDKKIDIAELSRFAHLVEPKALQEIFCDNYISTNEANNLTHNYSILNSKGLAPKLWHEQWGSLNRSTVYEVKEATPEQISTYIKTFDGVHEGLKDMFSFGSSIINELTPEVAKNIQTMNSYLVNNKIEQLPYYSRDAILRTKPEVLEKNIELVNRLKKEYDVNEFDVSKICSDVFRFSEYGYHLEVEKSLKDLPAYLKKDLEPYFLWDARDFAQYPEGFTKELNFYKSIPEDSYKRFAFSNPTNYDANTWSKMYRDAWNGNKIPQLQNNLNTVLDIKYSGYEKPMQFILKSTDENLANVNQIVKMHKEYTGENIGFYQIPKEDVLGNTRAVYSEYANLDKNLQKFIQENNLFPRETLSKIDAKSLKILVKNVNELYSNIGDKNAVRLLTCCPDSSDVCVEVLRNLDPDLVSKFMDSSALFYMSENYNQVEIPTTEQIKLFVQIINKNKKKITDYNAGDFINLPNIHKISQIPQASLDKIPECVMSRILNLNNFSFNDIQPYLEVVDVLSENIVKNLGDENLEVLDCARFDKEQYVKNAKLLSELPDDLINNLGKDTLIRMFRKRDLSAIMNSENMKFLKSLPGDIQKKLDRNNMTILESKDLLLFKSNYKYLSENNLINDIGGNSLFRLMQNMAGEEDRLWIKKLFNNPQVTNKNRVSSVLESRKYFDKNGESFYSYSDKNNDPLVLDWQKMIDRDLLNDIPERGENNQFSAEDRIDLSLIEGKQWERAQSILNIEGRQNEQFRARDIIDLVKLDDAQWKKAQSLFSINGDSQFTSYQIQELVTLDSQSIDSAIKMYKGGIIFGKIIDTLKLNQNDAEQLLSSLNVKELRNRIDNITDIKNRLDDTTKADLMKNGLDFDSIIKKINDAIKMTNTYIPTEKNVKIEMFKDFFANNNPTMETQIRNINLSQFGKEGIPLKYSRDNYINDINEAMKGLNQQEVAKIADYFKFVKTDEGFERFPQISSETIPETFTPEMISAVQKINKFTEDFTLKNETTIKDPELKKTLDSLIQGLPEFTTIIGKQQHGTHAYSVDIHTLMVLQKSINDPLYKNLSDTDKTILKLSVLMHDFGKQGGVVDKGHAVTSGQYGVNILSKFNLSIDVKNRIVEMVNNHHWFEAYNTGSSSPELVAALFRNVDDFSIAQIIAKADMASVNNNAHLGWMNVANEAEFNNNFDKKMLPVKEAIQANMEKANLIFDSRILNTSKIPMNEELGIRLLDMVNMEEGTDLTQFGFAPGVTKENARFTVHMVNNGAQSDLSTAGLLLNNPNNKAALSTSIISMDNKRTYQYRPIGYIIETPLSNISEATYRNVASGTGKGIDAFEEILSRPFDSQQRTFVQNEFKKALNTRGIEITDEEYSLISRQLMNKKYITQMKDIQFGNRILKKEDLIYALETSRDQLFQGGEHSEIVSLNPRAKALVALYDKIEDIPEDFIKYAKENNLPIILMGAYKY